MTDKKSNISIELVIIVAIILVVAFVVLTIFGKNTGRFAQWFNDTFTNEAKAQEITQFTEKSLTECFEMDTSSNIPFNGENLGIIPRGTDSSITINVLSSSGNELNCGKQKVMQLNKGAADCCLSPDTQFCAQFLGITSTGIDPDCAKIAYFSKDEWTLPKSQRLCLPKISNCGSSVEFWMGSDNAKIELVKIDNYNLLNVFGIKDDGAHFDITVKNQNGDWEETACVNNHDIGDNLLVNVGKTYDCKATSTSFELTLDDLSKNGYVSISVRKGSLITIS